MFLSVECHHDKMPRGWSERLRCGTSPDTPEAIRKHRELLKNERPPYCNTTVKWRDAEGIFWTIEEWFIKELERLGPIHVLKRDCETIAVSGTISLPAVNYKLLPRKSMLDKAEYELVGTAMIEYDLAPSWFEIDILKDQTIICRMSSDGPRIVHVVKNFYGVVLEDDSLHPVVTLS